MTPVLQILLVCGALLMLFFVLMNIKHSRLAIGDSLFWFAFALLLVVVAAFPILADKLAALVGIQSTQNLVFLLVILVLIFREFRVTMRMSQMNTKLRSVVTKMAIENDKNPQENENEEKEKKKEQNK